MQTRSLVVLAPIALMAGLACSGPPPTTATPPPTTAAITMPARIAVPPPAGERMARCRIDEPSWPALEVPVGPGETLAVADRACTVSAAGWLASIAWADSVDARVSPLADPGIPVGTGSLDVLGVPIDYAVARGMEDGREVDRVTGTRTLADGYVLVVSATVPARDDAAFSRALDLIARTRASDTPWIAGEACPRPNPMDDVFAVGDLTLPTRAEATTGPGSFHAPALLRMLTTRRSALASCFERELVCDRELHGTVVTTLTIDEQGSVHDVDATPGTLANERVHTCVGRVTQGFRFGADVPSGGPVTLTFTLGFAPRPL